LLEIKKTKDEGNPRFKIAIKNCGIKMVREYSPIP